MRIQNNITAMNTHRQYTINNDNVAKAAEKLSSGYRINRAGDDAAGLAISEKMRSQIRGLNMATKNSQDAISLVQTAEGALQETQNMLQRMNELAVQAATGTNQEEDRLALAKEFQQLKREINDIAEQTTFNNMKVLDGSISYEGYKRSAATAGVNITRPTESGASTSATPAPAGGNGGTVSKVNIGPDLTQAIGANNSVTLTASYTTADGKDAKVEFTTAQAGGSGATVSELLVGNRLTATGDDGTEWTAEVDDSGNIKLTSTNMKNVDTTEDITIKLSTDDTTAAAALTSDAATQANGVKGTTSLAASDQPKAITSTTVKGADGSADGDKGKFTVSVGSPAAAIAANQSIGLKVTIDGTDYNLDEAFQNASAYTADASGAAALAADLSGKSLTIEGAKYTISATGTTLTLQGDGNGSEDVTLSGATITVKLQTGATAAALTDNGNVTLTATGVDDQTKATTAATTETTTATVNADDLQLGDTITIGDKTYELVATAGDEKDGNVGIAWTPGTSTVSDLVQGINADPPAGVAVADGTTAGTITITANAAGKVKGDPTAIKLNGEATAPATPASAAAQKTGVTTVEFDFAKLQAGDRIQMTVGDADIDVTVSEGMTKDQFFAELGAQIEGADGVALKGTAIVADAGVAVSEVTFEDTLSKTETNALRIQVGALENEQLNISIDSMNTAGLNLDAHNLDTQDSAGAAITAVRAAVQKVSDQRATLGAMQNRLDHKIANLKVSSENLSAAESRIRDVDMASEMTNFTKNNILSQAATAMLAQANSLPQNVLSLLG